MGFLFLAWLALTLNLIRPMDMSNGPTMMDVFLLQVSKMFSRKRSVIVAEPSINASALTLGHGTVAIEEKAPGHACQWS
jgi:hypothetical protein